MFVWGAMFHDAIIDAVMAVLTLQLVRADVSILPPLWANQAVLSKATLISLFLFTGRSRAECRSILDYTVCFPVKCER